MDLSGKSIVVFGGGAVATRRVESLVKSCGRVVVVSSDFTPKLLRLAERHPNLNLTRRTIRADERLEEYVTDADLVVAATNNARLNSKIVAAGRSAKKLVNRVDCLAGSSIIFPAVFRKGDVMVAVSTGGRSPLLSKNLRQRLARMITATDVKMARLFEYSRRLAFRNLSGEQDRRRVLSRVATDSVVRDLLERGSLREAEARARRIILGLD
jgi:precorrin-2 dehydrogenase/sirohydrochlorin ferrochelatase